MTRGDVAPRPYVGPERIGVDDVRRKLLAGEPLLLVDVCDRNAYECAHLEGAVFIDDLHPPLGKGHEIVFYSPDEREAERRAAEYFDRGYVNAKVLAGGVAAWKSAGYPLSLSL